MKKGHVPIRNKPWPTYDKGFVDLTEADIQAVTDVMQSRRLFRYDDRPLEKTKVGAFEKALCSYFDVKHALAVSSGTAAITVALLATGIAPGSVVACPAFTFPATPSAILLAGFKPLLIEVDDHLHFDLADLEKKLTPEVKAIVPVHMRGMGSDMPKIILFAKKHKLFVVEDAVASCGAEFNGKKLGAFGDAGAFSTQSDKSINTGEGGFILTNNTLIYERALAYSGAYQNSFSKHISRAKSHITPEEYPLYNFRMGELQGALAVSQLSRLSQHLKRQRHVYDYVIKSLAHINEIQVREPVTDDAVLGEALLLQLKNSTGEKAAHFMRALRAEGIDCWLIGDPHELNVRAYWHWRFLFPNESIEETKLRLPKTTRILSNTIDIPLSSLLTKSDQEDLITAIKKVLMEIK